MTKYESHFVNESPAVLEAQFDVVLALEELVDVYADPAADSYEKAEAMAWIIQNYIGLQGERDALRQTVQRLEGELRESRPKNPPIWSGWSL